MSAETLKNEGNALFVKGYYHEAWDKYNAAYELAPTNPVYLSNRAQCELKLEQYGSAIESCTLAVEADPTHVKSFYRRALAHASLLHHKQALQDFQKVASLNPQFTEVQSRIAATKKLAREQAFLDAIRTEDEPSIFDTLDLSLLPEYDSPATEISIDLDNLTIETIERVIEHFKSGKRLSKRKALEIIKKCALQFTSEPPLVRVPQPRPAEFVTVCGDVHGQFYDFLNIFALNGFPDLMHTYVFNGDFVDRGSWSTEIALTLYLLKLLYPQNMVINRGNHESVSMNMVYGFSGECKTKYQSDLIFKAFTESFSRLPVACVIGNQHFVVHGGIASELGKPILLEDIEKIDRLAFKQPDSHPLLTELLWSDPRSANGLGNSGRGVAHVFGPDVTNEFLAANNLKTVIRSHEVRDEGYEFEHDKKLVTIFSAPNYCDTVGNKAAFIKIDHTLELRCKQFEAVRHPKIPAMAYAAKSI